MGLNKVRFMGDVLAQSDKCLMRTAAPCSPINRSGCFTQRTYPVFSNRVRIWVIPRNSASALWTENKKTVARSALLAETCKPCPPRDKMPRMGSCIVMENVTKRYGRTVAVGDLSLEVRQGEVLGLLGPNGAGKSTTIGMLSGLIRPSSGRISVFGLDLARDRIAIARRMGVLVERPAFPEYLSVRRVLKIHALLAGSDNSVESVMARTGLAHVARKHVGALSQGMRQRLGIAQAILTEPELLILDEPTSGLDVEGTRDTLRFLRRLCNEAGVTIVFSSHQMQEVEALCDRVAILNEGGLVACEEKETLLSWDLSEVDLLVDRPEEAAAELAGLGWVVSVGPRPGGLHVHLEGPKSDELAAWLVGRGFRVAGMAPHRRTLEDYFLRVTEP